MMSDHRYKPTEHGGLKEDGTTDKRVKEHESDDHRKNAEQLAHGAHRAANVDAGAGKSTAQVSGAHSSHGRYKPTEHGGLKEDGTPDKRVKEHESEAHRQNAEELAHGSHNAANVDAGGGKSAAQVGGEHSAHGKYKPTEHGGLKEDGTPDRRTKTGKEAS